MPVFAEASLQQQLGAYAAEYAAAFVQVDVPRRLITLPKQFDWFAHDFSASSAPLDVARGVAALLPAACEVRRAMDELLAAPPRPHVRYAPYTWACHPRLTEWRWQPPAR